MNNILIKLINKYLLKHNIEGLYSIELKVSKKKEFGDITTNIAMKIAKDLEKKPIEIAQEIIELLNKDNSIEKAELAGPGFINIYFNSLNKYDVINTIIKEKEKYGKSDIDKGKRVNLEFVSANPTGHLHIGHARNAILGDIMGKMMESTGWKVDREYWVNDYGNQMIVLANSIYQFYLKQLDDEYNIPEKTDYKGPEIKNAAKLLYEKVNDKYKDKKFEDISFEIAKWGGKHFIDEIKTILSDIGVLAFDLWQSENEIYKSGKVEESLNKLKKIKGATYIKDGALWLATTKNSNDDKDRVIQKEDGNFTYIVGDIANHVEKYSKNYDLYINIWGADHAGYDQRVKSSINWLGLDDKKLIVDFMQMVRLIKDGKEFKMSKRKGTVITIRDLLNLFGKNRLRYFIASKQMQSHFDLDVSLLEDDTNSSPLHYSTYSYVRALKIIEQNNKEYKVLINHKFENLKSIQESELVKSLSKMTSVIQRGSKLREPQVLIVYINELAQLFHSFYSSCRIKGESKELGSERLSLVQAYIYVMENLYKLIGIEPPKEM